MTGPWLRLTGRNPKLRPLLLPGDVSRAPEESCVLMSGVTARLGFEEEAVEPCPLSVAWLSAVP